MRQCIVWCCQSKGSIKGVQYFNFTKARLSEWSRALNRNPSEISCHANICSLHFTPDDFYEKDGQKRLKSSAIPSLKLKASTLNTSQQICFIKGKYRAVTIPNNENIQPVEEDLFQFEGESLQLRGDTQSIPSTSGISRHSFSTHASEECKTDRAASILDPSIAEQGPEIVSSSDSSVELVQHEKQSDNEKKRKIKESTTDSEGLKGSPKKRRRLLRTYHTYCKSPRKLSHSVVELKKQKSDLRQSCRNEHRKVMRLRNKVSSMYQVVRRLKKTSIGVYKRRRCP